VLEVANRRTPSIRFRLFETLSRISRRFGQAAAASWTSTILRHQARLNLDQLRNAIARGQLSSIEAAIDPTRLQMVLEKSTRDTLRRAAQEGGQISSAALKRAGLQASFNAVHPNVVHYAQTQAARLVTNIPDDLRAAIRTVTALGAAGQLTVEEQASILKSAIGLPRHQLQAPLRFGEDLRAGNLGAAARRFTAAEKQMIRSRIAQGTVTPAFIQQMQGIYSERLIAARAETIARTETLAAINHGVHESWRQSVAEGDLPKTARRMWILTPDERLCPICAEIPGLNPDGVGMEEAFDTPEGPVMDPPAPHPNCRCSVGLIFPDTTTPEDAGAATEDTGEGAGAGVSVPLPTGGPATGAVFEGLSDEQILKLPSSSFTPKTPNGADTFAKYVTRPGGWGEGEFTAERTALHDAIIRRHFEDVTKVTEGRRQALVLGGGPAAGKSSIAAEINLVNHVKVDVDKVRALLPEYIERVAAGDLTSATFAQEEASAISKKIVKQALDNGYNVVIDATGDGSYDNLAANLQRYREAGVRVIGQYISVDTDIAYTRMLERARRATTIESKRIVPEAYFREVHHNISAVVPRAIADGLFDEVTLWDNHGAKPIKFAHSVGRNLQVLDEALYQRFLSKARDGEKLLEPVRKIGALGSSVTPEGLANYLGAYGQEWTAAPLPPGLGPGTPKQCYLNATHLVLEHPDWRYVEGVAYAPDLGDIPFLHAWAVTPEGRVVDVTWRHPEGARYFGVAYEREAYLKYIAKEGMYGVMGGEVASAARMLETGAAGLRQKVPMALTPQAIQAEAQKLYERYFGFQPRHVPAWGQLASVGDFSELRTKYLAQAEINLRKGKPGKLPPNPGGKYRKRRSGGTP